MSNIADSRKYFDSHSPTFQDGSPFLGFRLPAAQTFTSYSPSNDVNSYLQAITGKGGWKQRQLLQSNHGTNILSRAVRNQLDNSVSNLAFPGYHSRSSCQRDTDCASGQLCYTFNDQVFGAQQGPVCSYTVYPEISLGNQFNKGIPLRQHNNFCMSDKECTGKDEFTGKSKQGMKCNHYIKGSSMREDIGMCQVEYESKGKRFFLQQPPGMKMPMNEPLQTCKSDIDCGDTGINGWTRCQESGDGNSYCTWAGQTFRQNSGHKGHLAQAHNSAGGAVGPVPMSLPGFK